MYTMYEMLCEGLNVHRPSAITGHAQVAQSKMKLTKSWELGERTDVLCLTVAQPAAHHLLLSPALADLHHRRQSRFSLVNQFVWHPPH